MKRTFTFMASMLFVMYSFAQQVEVLPQYGFGWGGGVEVDLNNDGHLDLIMSGLSKTKQFVEDPDGNQVETEKVTHLLMYNPTTKAYEPKVTPLLNADRAHFSVADFNGDGIMDLVITEHARDALYNSGMYQGVGDGTFTQIEAVFTNIEGEFKPVANAVADFNNDGLIDVVAIGYEKIDDVVTNYSSVLINKGDFNFEATNTELLQEFELALSTVKVLDHNNDGYMDFFISSNLDNPASNGDARVLADIFENLGADEPGTFFRLNLGSGTIFQKANGGLDIADLNADGWLDFIIHGEGGAGTGEPTSGDIWASISHVYINQKNGLYSDKAQPNFSADLRPLNSSGMSTRVFDWNGDGHFDVFIPGWNPAPETGTQAAFLWLNDGTGTFGQKTRIPGSSESAIFFPDWNGDGIRDYFMAGQSWDAMYFPTEDVQGRTAAVLLNSSTVVNERPSAPSNLAAEVSGTGVTLSWDAATDKESPANILSYEYFLKKDGMLYNSVRSFVGGDLDGTRKVLDLGNAMLNKSITLNSLPGGTYEWGVQAIDASYAGSVFATGTFTIVGNTSVDDLVNTNKVNVYATRNMVNITSQAPATVQIYAITGALVYTKENVISHSTSLPQGFYIVKVSVDNQPVVRKVVVE